MLMMEMKKVWRGVSDNSPPPISEPIPNFSGYVSKRSKECFSLSRIMFLERLEEYLPFPIANDITSDY